MLAAVDFPDWIYLGPGVRPQADLRLLGTLVRPLPRGTWAAFRAVGLTGVPGWIYTIHLDEPLGNEKQWAWHYTGWTEDLANRLLEHAAGRGSRMLEVARQRRIGWQVVAVYPGTRAIEAGIKDHSAAVRCPSCNPRPSVPRLSLRLAAELQCRADKDQRPLQRRSRQLREAGPYTTGVRRGGEWAEQMRSCGMTADQIEAAHRDAMTATPAAGSLWEAKHQRGYDDSVRSVLIAMRRAGRQLQTA